MPHSGALLQFILFFVLLRLPLVTSRSLYARNSYGTVDVYSSNVATARIIRRMQQAAMVPVPETGALSSSQHSPPESLAVEPSSFRDDGASSSTDPTWMRPHAPPLHDIEMGLVRPSAISQTIVSPSSTAVAQNGHPRTQHPPPAQQTPRPDIFWDPVRKACVTTYTGMFGCAGGVVCVIGGLASSETAIAAGGGVCAFLGAVLTREGYAEWKKYEELENLEQQQREGRRGNLRPRELGRVGFRKRAMAPLVPAGTQCHCRRLA
jgi:hypothetical protein